MLSVSLICSLLAEGEKIRNLAATLRSDQTEADDN